jgi:UDP-N-acetylmuramyl pentapeptide phosphotransferase/UDP-N-acetylglucosamine-1-phosphate transferase
VTGGRLAAIVGFGTGMAAGSGARWALAPDLARPALRRFNARGREVATAAGLAPLASVLGAGGANGLRRGGAWQATTLAGAGLGAAGLLDDLAGERKGTGGPRGLGGHLAELRRGRVTTGTVKLVAGAASGIGAAAATGRPLGRFGVVEGGLVIALAANLGNLLDRAPGRTTKVALLAAAGLVGAGRLPSGPAFAVGATAATLTDDLGERVMLGDTGANLVGAALGVAVVDRTGAVGRRMALLALVGLTLASERWSFSRVIEATPPLAWADRLGRPA